jgi:hypothetical protein
MNIQHMTSNHVQLFCTGAILLQNIASRLRIIDSNTHSISLLFYTLFNLFNRLYKINSITFFDCILYLSYFHIVYGVLQHYILAHDLSLLEIASFFSILNCIFNNRLTLLLHTYGSFIIICIQPIIAYKLFLYNYDAYTTYSFSLLATIVLSLKKKNNTNLSCFVYLIPMYHYFRLYSFSTVVAVVYISSYTSFVSSNMNFKNRFICDFSTAGILISNHYFKS